MAGWRAFRRGSRFAWTSVDVGVLSWLAAVVTAGALLWVREGALDAAALRDVGTTLYLALLFFAIRIVGDEEILGAASAALILGATLAAALGVIGFGLSELGVRNVLAFAADSAYPYLGNAARARALTSTPNMLASILMLALLLLGAGAVAKLDAGWRRLAAGILAAGFALTFSKTLVALAAGGLVVWVLRRGSSRLERLGVAVSWLVAAAVFGVFSHVLILGGEGERERLEQAMFTSGKPIGTLVAAGRVYPTSYYFLKRASLIAVERSWPWGIGPGGHAAFVGRLQQEGLYPETLWQSLPHSSYTGAATELGLAGVFGLAAFLGGLALGIRDALRRGVTRPLAVAAAGALAALLIEAIATDVMHFRHYTWLAALVGSAAARSRS